jgi:hypothetical protein
VRRYPSATTAWTTMATVRSTAPTSSAPGPPTMTKGSFATDIPGDNQDSYTQDCFYDGNSGGNPGNDCIRHTCCFSDATNQDECDAFLEAIGVGAGGPNFDPAECDVAVSDGCIEHCDAVTPPGCDCFGCCTVCDPTTG